MKKYILSFMRKPKLWMRPSEMKTWFVILVWCLDLNIHKSQLWILITRIHDMWVSQGLKRKNLRFVHSYLKEAYTICLSVLTGTTYTPKIRVKVGKLGLPLIIPGKLRQLMLSDRTVHTAVLTILCLHRLVPWWPSTDLHTILDVFAGSLRTLDFSLLEKSWERLCKLSKTERVKFISNFKPIQFLELLSTGPNGRVSLTSAVEDAFAFYREPHYFCNLVLWFILFRGWTALICLCSILLLGFPLWLIRRCPKYNIGKLGVVYNVSGKARVIGITNYWVQIGLYPLHDKILKFLSTVEQDGTFDQLAPLNRLQEGKVYSSFDLTAATDRLPLDLQKDVLRIVTGSWLISSIWANLARMPMWVPWENRFIYYSVGQPMGMYSSWAMLALTHHMIVNAASILSNTDADDYAILGDDVVVPEDFSEAYSRILSQLGVMISVSKSIVSGIYVEFAKRVKTLSGVDYSVLGPGLILSACRDRFVSASLLLDASKKGLVKWTEVPSRMLLAPGLSSDPVAYSFGISLIRSLSMENFKPSDAISLEIANEWFLKKHRSNAQLIFNPTALRDECLERLTLNSQVAAARLEQLPHDMWELALERAGFLGFLYFLLLLFSPLPWVTLRLGDSLIGNARDVLAETLRLPFDQELPILWKEIKELEVNSFNPFDKKQSRSTMSVWRKLFRIVWVYH